MVKEFSHFLMVRNMKGISLTINLMASGKENDYLVNTNGLIRKVMKENGKIIKWMDMELWY